MISDGKAFNTFTSFNFNKLKPVIIVIKPPTLTKLAETYSVIIGDKTFAAKNNAIIMMNCGIANAKTKYPIVEARIIDVKRSKTDFAIKMLESFDIPSFIAPKMPVPLKQNITTADATRVKSMKLSLLSCSFTFILCEKVIVIDSYKMNASTFLFI